MNGLCRSKHPSETLLPALHIARPEVEPTSFGPFVNRAFSDRQLRLSCVFWDIDSRAANQPVTLRWKNRNANRNDRVAKVVISLDVSPQCVGDFGSLLLGDCLESTVLCL